MRNSPGVPAGLSRRVGSLAAKKNTNHEALFGLSHVVYMQSGFFIFVLKRGKLCNNDEFG